MQCSHRKEIEHHLTEKEIDELLREAEDDHHVSRLGFLKNLYQGDSIPEAADREGRSAATGGRWADAWNKDEQNELVEMLRDGQLWKSQEIQHLLQEEFGVSYSPKLSRYFPSETRSLIRETTVKTSTSTRELY